VSEAFRKLRTNLRYVSVGEPLKTLLITSAEPAAGKTSVAANLGVVCAQAGLRVILIDADLRFPKLHGRFGVANHVGLTNLLVGDISTVTGCIIETRIDGLALITGGSVPPNPPDLLDSRSMRELLDEVSTNADLVIIDTPPVLAVSDTTILAQEADGVLLVIDARKTRQDAAQHAVQGLRQVGANVFGVVLNAVPVRRGSYYYSYIYHRSKGQKHLRRPRLWDRSMAAVEWAFRGKQKVR
jgi:capsular exopolysaccharide synthesis family protein